MAEVVLSLPELYQKRYGYKTKDFEPDFDAVPNPRNGRTAPDYRTGTLGIQYHLPVFIADPRQQDSRAFSGTAESEKGWYLPHPVISIESKKTIVETAMSERNGTVKELVSTSDYVISVKGFVISDDGEFPADDMEMLRTIYELNEPLSIRCSLTDIFLIRPDRKGSDQVVITELRFPEVSGIKNVRPYEMKMVSAAPFNLVSI